MAYSAGVPPFHVGYAASVPSAVISTTRLFVDPRPAWSNEIVHCKYRQASSSPTKAAKGKLAAHRHNAGKGTLAAYPTIFGVFR